MPASTACAGLPYPLASDPPDVQGFFQGLAEAVDVAVCGIGGVPIGAIIPWWDTNGPTPEGKLRCDGTAFNPATYPLLQAHLSATTTPDLRGRFLRGTDQVGGPFPGKGQTGGYNDAVNVAHAHAVVSHVHTFNHYHDATSVNDSHVHTNNHDHPPTTTTIGSGTVAGGNNLAYFKTGDGGYGNVSSNFSAGSGLDYGGLPILNLPNYVGVTGNDSHNHAINVGLNYPSLSGSAEPVTNEIGTNGSNRNLPPFANVTFLIQAS